jgi:hypothetical protein
MKIKEVYVSFLDTVNRNMTNNNVNVDLPRFITLLNTTLTRYVSWILEKRNEDVIRYISPLLILEKELAESEQKPNFTTFHLPKDYFDFANLHIYASKGKCKLQKLKKPFEVKSENIEELLGDSSNSPSFEYRETFYLTTENKVAVYKSDFKIDKVDLSYYRYPKKLDIEGYIKLDDTPSVDIDPELDDKVMNKVIIAMAKQFSATNGDTTGYEIQSNALFSEI